jgi:hypothetical protein
LWLQDKLRPVEPSVKGWPKKYEVIANVEHFYELKYSRFHRFSSANSRPHFRLFPAAYPPLYRSYSTAESADFPRLFRMFCTSDCARLFPQALRSDFAGFAELSRKEKGRKRSEVDGAAEKRPPLAVCCLLIRFPLRQVESFDWRRSPREPRTQEDVAMEKKKIELMLKEIQNRGGLVGISDNLTDEQKEFFLQEILSCPDCIEEVERMAGVSARRPRDH